jgi:predicted Zn-dependent protease
MNHIKKALPIAIVVLLTLPAVAHIPATTLLNGTITVLKWDSNAFPVTWQMNPTQSSNVTGTPGQRSVFQSAFQEWEDITTALVSFTEGALTDASVKPDGDDGINLITTNVTEEEFNNLGAGAIGLAIPISINGVTQEVDIMFNPTTSFSTEGTTPGDRIDLESVATHEVGHLLGLDHSNILAATMFPSVVAGSNHPRDTELDDQIGVSALYPVPTFAASTGSLSGTVRTMENVAVYGALVVAIDSGGQAVASQVTDPSGQYTMTGLPPGSYTIYAEPMNQPFQFGNAPSLAETYPGESINSNFTVRFR